MLGLGLAFLGNRSLVAQPANKWFDPANDHQWQPYVEEEPDADYRHASEQALEAFHDWKYGIRLHWGVYAMLNKEASWGLVRDRSVSHADRQHYQELYKRWNPQDFDAESWMRLFADNGVRCMAFTTKHHDGFSLYDTKTRVKQRVNYVTGGGPTIEDCDQAYGIMETPFGRDVVKELCEAARRHNV